MFRRVLLLWVALPCAATTVAGLSSDSAPVPPPIAAKQARPPAPPFYFFAPRAGALVTMREDPAIRSRVEAENREYGQSMAVRTLLGRPVLLYFWSSAAVVEPSGQARPLCPACPAAMDAMEGLHLKYALSGLQVVGLGIVASPADLQAAAARYSHLTGSYAGDAAAALGLKTVPAWALIDKEGLVAAASDKGVDAAYLAAQIEGLLR